MNEGVRERTRKAVTRLSPSQKIAFMVALGLVTTEHLEGKHSQAGPGRAHRWAGGLLNWPRTEAAGVWAPRVRWQRLSPEPGPSSLGSPVCPLAPGLSAQSPRGHLLISVGRCGCLAPQ